MVVTGGSQRFCNSVLEQIFYIRFRCTSCTYFMFSWKGITAKSFNIKKLRVLLIKVRGSSVGCRRPLINILHANGMQNKISFSVCVGFFFVFLNYNQQSLPASLPVLRGQTATLSKISSDFSLSATSAAFKLLITLQQRHAVHLEKHGTRHLSWEIIIKKSKQKETSTVK